VLSAQVYGGAISMMIGSYVYSLIGSGISIATSGETLCIDCAVAVTGVSIINSATRSMTSGNVCRLPAVV
jgi:hypothetical protein